MTCYLVTEFKKDECPEIIHICETKEEAEKIIKENSNKKLIIEKGSDDWLKLRVKMELEEHYTRKFSHCKTAEEFIQAVDKELEPLQEVIDTGRGDVEGAKKVIKSTKALAHWKGENYNHHKQNIGGIVSI